jgi:hypothetical protein
MNLGMGLSSLSCTFTLYQSLVVLSTLFDSDFTMGLGIGAIAVRPVR